MERQWENQMQYLISISGKAFWIGGNIGLEIKMLPLGKMKVHRISVVLEGEWFIRDSSGEECSC